MTLFARFIFVVVVLGITVNLGIVLLANVSSERRREAQWNSDRESFEALVGRVDNRLRRAEIGVEWQTLDAADQCLESGLLVRQYYKGEREDKAMPVARLKIAGNKIKVHGILVEFDALYAGADPTLRVLRNRRLAYFDRIEWGEKGKEESHRWLADYQVPELTRLAPVLATDFPGSRWPPPSVYEAQVWQRIWDGIKGSSAYGGRGDTGVTVLRVSAEREVRRGQVLWAWLGADGLTLEERRDSGLLPEMRAEADKREQ